MPIRTPKSLALGSLSMTPLIDCIFLLLIFFLVATRFEQEERELELSLAQARDAKPMIVKPQELFINVTEDGQYFVNGRLFDADSLERGLTHVWKQNPGKQRVIIRAHADSKMKHVVTVMNLCNKAHIRDYSIAAE